MSIDKSKMDKYVDGKLVQQGKRDNAVGEAINFRWWKSPEDKTASEVAHTVKFMQDHQASRIDQLTNSTRYYGNSSAFGLTGAAYTKANNNSPSGQRISFNLCSSVIDDLTNMMAANVVIPTFVTNGGDWNMQAKAKNLTKFIEGCFYKHKIHKKGVETFRHAGVWGTGILHVFERFDDIAVEHVYPHELVVDLVESMVTYPKQLHRVKTVDRDSVLADFPDKAEEIEGVDATDQRDIGGLGTAADLVTLIESWHLPSGPDAGDGLHLITCGDKELFREVWTKDYYPFVFRHYSKQLIGFWGTGACQRLASLQGEINKLMILVQRSMWMNGSFKVLLETGSKVVTQHLNNDVGALIHYTGTKPEYITPPMIQQDIYPYIDALIQKGYNQEGVSQMSAASQKPQGLDSGKAIRAMNNIESQRFEDMEQDQEAFYLEVARQMIEVAKEIYSRKKTFKVVFPSNKFMETIDWKDIKLKDSEYVLKAYPTSSLAKDFSGRLSDIQEGMQAGLISPRLGKRLMAFPDVEAADRLSSAPEDLLHKVIENMLEKGDYRPPEPYMDLVLAKQLILEYYNYADLQGCPEDRLDLLRRFQRQVDDALKAAQPPAAPGAPGAPMANPTATPTSNLVPNTNQAVAA